MGLNDEDEDLVALRLAALSTMKAKRASENSMKLKSSRGSGGVSIRDGFGNKNNALFQPHMNSNLIAIVPISPNTVVEQPRTRRVPAFRQQQQQQQPNKLILPQHRYCKTNEAAPAKKEKPAVKTKFNRYDSSSSESSEESEDEGSTASGERVASARVPVDKEPSVVREEKVPEGGGASDIESEPSFLVELENDAAGPEKEDSAVPPETPGDPPPSPPPKENVVPPATKSQRSPVRSPVRSPQHRPVTRSRSKSPFYPCRPYVDRSRSRSRSRSRPRLGRSRSPRRYVPRRSVSPKRRAVSPRYVSPRRRSPLGGRLSPHGHPSPTDRFSQRRRSPLSPGGRRRPPIRASPPRRYGSPPLSPRRRSSPWRRQSPSPPRRHYSPPGRLSPPRRRKSPSPVKRNPSPPRRFSPQRRSPLGRRVSPPRRNPSPPRKLYPISGQQPRLHSPRRYPSPPRGASPRRYNGQPIRRVSPVGRPAQGPHSQPVGDMSPWSPPRKRSLSPRPRNRRASVSPPFVKGDRKTLSPRPTKRRDSASSPHFEPRKGSISPRPDYKRRKAVSPRGAGTSPNFGGGRRKSVSPAASPLRFAPKRRRSFSPRGPRPGSKKRSNSPSGAERRVANSPAKTRRLDERDARTATRAARENSKSLSLSPPPERVKVKSPLRVRAHRHEAGPTLKHAERSKRTNGKKRSKSKKSRDKTSAPTAEKTDKTEKTGDNKSSSVLEARRKKFESADPIKPVNKKIRLKTAGGEQLAEASPKVDDTERPTSIKTVTSADLQETDDEDALVLDSPANLWSDEESDSGNEGRFKSAGVRADANARKVGVLSFKNLLQPSAKPEPKRVRDRVGTRERRSPASRDKKRRRDVLDRVGDRGAWKTKTVETMETGASPDRLPALLSQDIPKPEHLPKSSVADEPTPEPVERVSRLDQADQHGDLRAALSRKRAARSNILFPFKGGDKGKLPGSRLVQSAFLDAVGKKHKRSKKTLTQPSLLKLADNLDDEAPRKPPVRLRLGLPQLSDDAPGGRKVKLKRNNAASDQV